MKRFIPTLMLVAIFAGIFSPVTTSFVGNKGSAPIHASVAQAQSGVLGTAPNHADPSSYNKTCGVAFGSFSGCLEWIFYYIPFQLGTFAMTLSAKLFDGFAAITLSSKMYGASMFITEGWRLTRDFANIFFVIILLYIAISLVLGIEVGHANPKKMLASLVLIALLINFSLLITEVIIDSSNALALVFYNQISVTATNKDGQPLTPIQSVTDADNKTQIELGVKPKPISEALVAAFQPQVLYSAEFYDKLKVKTGGKFSGWTAAGGATAGAIAGSFIPGIGTLFGGAIGFAGGALNSILSEGHEVPPSIMIGLYIVIGTMFLVVAYSFFIAALSFVGRLVGLWIAIIFAPLAFISYIIPSMRTIPGFGWNEWWKNLLSTAFSAPIYFFFLLLISMMTKSKIISADFEGDSWNYLFIILVSFLILVVMLIKATKYIKKASGELGDFVFKAAAMAGGLGLMVGAGSLAMLGRKTAGAFYKAQDTNLNRDLAAGKVNSETRAKLLSKFQTGKDAAGNPIYNAEGSALSKMTHEELAKSSQFQQMQRRAETKLKTAQRLSSSSFDFRQTGAANVVSKFTGMNMEGMGAFSTARTAGGYDALQAKRAKKLQDFASRFGTNHEQQNEIEDTVADRKRKLTAARNEATELRVNQNDTGTPTNVYIDGVKTSAASGKAAYEMKLAEISRLESGNIKGDNVVTQDDLESGRDHRAGTADDRSKTADGYKFQDSDVGKTRDRYSMADVAAKKKKADGTEVTEMDVRSGMTRTESMSMQQLERLKDGAERDRANSYFHQKMVQSGYDVHGEKFNDLGGIARLGHMDFKSASKEAMEGWRKDISRNMAKGMATGIVSTLVGTAIAGSGVGLAAAFAGALLSPNNSFLSGFKDAIRGAANAASPRAAVRTLGGNKAENLYNKLGPGGMGPGFLGDRRMYARAVGEASDSHAKIKEFQSTYKAEAGGFLGFLKGLMAESKHGGGGDHGGGGHAADSGGGGGHGGGGHH